MRHLNIPSAIVALLLVVSPAPADLAPSVRGIATRAPAEMKIDGDLSEFKEAFCTPINYFHPNLRNRAAQFFYMWDDDAFYAGLRTLDQVPHNGAPDDRLWEGDGVEWYFDTTRGANFRAQGWLDANTGGVHCYWVGLQGREVKPRFCLRPGYYKQIPKTGVEVGARRTKTGMEVEFKLPWANFPQFKAKLNEVIALDAELCYADGGPRVDRFFAFGSPLSVQQPSSLAQVQLVEKLEPAHWKACGPVMMPIRVDTEWGQGKKAHAHAWITLPPNQSEQIGKIVIRLTDLDGKTIGEHEAKIKPHCRKCQELAADPTPACPKCGLQADWLRTPTFEKEGNFQRALAEWPVDSAAPGTFHATAIVYDKQGKELTRIAPRMVSTAMQQGY